MANRLPTVKEFAERKAVLWLSKRVDEWPISVDLGDSDDPITVDLSVSECTWLGGSVVYHAGCGTTLMKCVAANGREMCIDKIA
jgi:hypothetical protein